MLQQISKRETAQQGRADGLYIWSINKLSHRLGKGINEMKGNVADVNGCLLGHIREWSAATCDGWMHYGPTRLRPMMVNEMIKGKEEVEAEWASAHDGARPKKKRKEKKRKKKMEKSKEGRLGVGP